MKLTVEQFKKYIIDHGHYEIAGKGKNAFETYVLPGNAVYIANFSIFYDGSKGQYFIQKHGAYRYNSRRDVIQEMQCDWYGDKTWRDLKIKENTGIFTDAKDISDYKEEYYDSHIEDAIKTLKKELGYTNSAIRSHEKMKKKYEKQLIELQSQLQQ